MDKTTLTTAMTTSISDVLETMFFLPIEISSAAKVEDLWNADQTGMLAARLDYKGPVSGHCILFMPEKLSVDITADFLGETPENVADEQSHGTVKEIINMIVGNLFSLLDPQAVFDLGIPNLVAFGENCAGAADANQEIFMALNTLESHLAIRIFFNAA